MGWGSESEEVGNRGLDWEGDGARTRGGVGRRDLGVGKRVEIFKADILGRPRVGVLE